VWTVADYRLRFTLKGHEAPVVSAVFAGNDKTIRKWGFPYPFYSDILETNGIRLEGLSFTGDGKKAVAIDRTGQVFEWAYNGGLNFVLNQKYPLNGTAGLTCMALSPGGKMAIGKDKEVQLWDLPQRSLIEQLTTDLHSVEALAFNADGSQLLAVGFDSLCLVLKADYLEMLIDKTPLSELDENSRSQFPAQLSLLDANGLLSQFDRNNHILVRHGVDGECSVNAYSEEGFLCKSFYPLPGQRQDCNAPLIAIHPSGQLILSAAINGRIFIWEIDKGRGEVMGF
jgi:WD40 repeat protein